MPSSHRVTLNTLISLGLAATTLILAWTALRADSPWQGPLPAAAPTPESDPDAGPWLVRIYYENRDRLGELRNWVEPWAVVSLPREVGAAGYVVVEVSSDVLRDLRRAGYRVEIDEELEAQLGRPNVRLAGQTGGIPGYPCYRTVEETLAAGEAIVAGYPELATWTDIGDSWQKAQDPSQGYHLMALRLTNTALSGPKPKLLIAAGVHAREYAPPELAARFAEYLVAGYDLDPDVTWLLDHHEIHLILQVNPDGRKKAETGLFWRKNTDPGACTDAGLWGVDLNRNFEFSWGCCGASSGDPCVETYRGPAAASEPETQALQQYVRGLVPDQRAPALDAAAPVTATGVFIDLHSFGRWVLWPWGFTTAEAPNGPALQTLGRKFAYLTGYEPAQADELYLTEGTTEEFAYGELGLAAYTLELGTTFFEGCARFEDTILPAGLQALLYAAKVARTPYLLPAGPDALDLEVHPERIGAGQAVSLTALVDDTRYLDYGANEPTQEVVAAEYYLDAPPWSTAPLTHSFSLYAEDGAFDGHAERVRASVDTSSLSVGRHSVFLRGQDAQGNWGPVNAAFLYVHQAPGLAIEPLVATKLAPAGTTVTYTVRITNTSPVSHSYVLSVDGGQWETSVPTVAGPLAAGARADIAVAVTPPTGSQAGDSDVATVTIVSSQDESTQAFAVLTTIVEARRLWLPLLHKAWQPGH